jgi:hypothetical protein
VSNKHDVHTKGDSTVVFQDTGWHQSKANWGIRRLLPSGLALKDGSLGPKDISSSRDITPFHMGLHSLQDYKTEEMSRSAKEHGRIYVRLASFVEIIARVSIYHQDMSPHK